MIFFSVKAVNTNQGSTAVRKKRTGGQIRRGRWRWRGGRNGL